MKRYQINDEMMTKLKLTGTGTYDAGIFVVVAVADVEASMATLGDVLFISGANNIVQEHVTCQINE